MVRLALSQSILSSHLPFLNLFLFFALLFLKLFIEDLELMKREFNVVLDLQCNGVYITLYLTLSDASGKYSIMILYTMPRTINGLMQNKMGEIVQKSKNGLQLLLE